MHVIGWTPATPLSPHFLPGYVRAEPGRTGRDLERGTFYSYSYSYRVTLFNELFSGVEKERFLSYPGITGYARV